MAIEIKTLNQVLVTASIKNEPKDQELAALLTEKWEIIPSLSNATSIYSPAAGIVDSRIVTLQREAPEPFGELAVAYEEGYVDRGDVLPIRVAAAAQMVTQAREARPFVNPQEELDELYEACLMVQAENPVAALKHDTLDIYTKILAVDDVYGTTEEYVVALQDALAAVRPHLDAIIAHMEGRTLSTTTKDSEE